MVAYVPEVDSVTRESLMETAVSLGHPSAVVRTFNMRVYEVPQDVYDALFVATPPIEESESRHKRPRRTKTHEQQSALDAPLARKEATDGS